ncbi:hypothetical protein [Aquimarina longa]|uniref:hypothetical protein n=1 Tax=Aquimarina longa TaxID=1080221 RepID=UPI0007863D6D|nr:hypothetical protein [Aquimarina longa]
MKKIIYITAYILALGSVACGSDDDGINCTDAEKAVGNTAMKFNDDATKETCGAYKVALEDVINNNCSTTEEELKIYRLELKRIGDCTLPGIVCLSCTNSGITILVCRGPNGNAFIKEKDIGVPFERYVELSNCKKL